MTTMRALLALAAVAIAPLLFLDHAQAANRIFPLYLKNGLSQPVTFKVEMGSCYQGTGYYPPHQLVHGPIPPGKSVKLDIARVQSDGCDGQNGHFTVKPTNPVFNGEGQGFSFDNAGGLWTRQIPDSYLGLLGPKSTRDESYTWTISSLPPLIEPNHGRIVRIRHAESGEYLTQAYSGTRDDQRNVTVWALPATRDDSFRWVLQQALGGYWTIVNLATGLVLTWDGNDPNVSNWGSTPDNPNQLWKFERNQHRYMIINKATGQGLTQAYGGKQTDKKNVTIWPNQTFAERGWSWRLEDAGSAYLYKLTIQSVKAIKTSTGQDIGTEILFGAIEAAVSGGNSAFKEIGKGAAKVTTRQVIKSVSKAAAKGAAESAAQGSAAELTGIDPDLIAAATDPKSAMKDMARDEAIALGRSEGGDVGALAGSAMDAVDAFGEATSLQNAFNTIYGESPDDLDIHVNGVSIWPNGGRDSRKIQSQWTLPVNTEYLFDRSKGMAMQLVEYDYGSDDDSLGWIAFTAEELSEPQWLEGALARNDSEGSLYAVTFTIGPAEMTADEIERVVRQRTEPAETCEEKSRRESWQRGSNQSTGYTLPDGSCGDRVADVDPGPASPLTGSSQMARKVVAAKLTLLSSIQPGANGRNRLPLIRDDPIAQTERLLAEPALMLDVTFSDGSVIGPYEYITKWTDNIVFDDESGDPGNLIELVYDSANKPAWLKATGNGTGTAQLFVSFRDAPGVTASVPVEIVSGIQSMPPPVQQTVQEPVRQPMAAVPVTAELALQSGIQPGANGRNRIPVSRSDPAYTVEQLDISPAIYLSVALTDGRTIEYDYHQKFPGNVIFDDTSGDPNDLIAVSYWDIDDNPQLGKFAAQLTSTGNGVGTAYLKVSFRDAPGLTASVPVEVISGREQQETRAAQAEPVAIDLSGQWTSQYTCPTGETLPLYLTVSHRGQSVSAVTSLADNCLDAGTLAWSGMLNGNAGQLQCGQIYNSGYGIAIEYVPGELQVVSADYLMACTLPFTRATSAPPVVDRQAEVTQPDSPATYYNALATEFRSAFTFPVREGILDLTYVYSLCPAGCEVDFADSTLAMALTLYDHSFDEVPFAEKDGFASEVDFHARDLFTPLYCQTLQGVVSSGNNAFTMTLIVDDRHGARVSNPVLTPTDCAADMAR